MKVRTLKPHRNLYGAHAVGDEYPHRDPASDIRFGYVEKVPAEDKTIPELEAQAAESGIALPTEGSGADGRVVKADIVKAVKKP